jgi:hypothetical protein
LNQVGDLAEATGRNRPNLSHSSAKDERHGAVIRLFVTMALEPSSIPKEMAVLHFDEAKNIWQSYVPKSGQAETVQGELLRAIEKLRDEATRNGNGNWDDGFEILIQYLEDHLLDPTVFGPSLIEKTRTSLARVQDFENPCLADELYEEMTDRAFEYFRFYGSKPHANNPKLRR